MPGGASAAPVARALASPPLRLAGTERVPLEEAASSGELHAGRAQVGGCSGEGDLLSKLTKAGKKLFEEEKERSTT